MTGLRRTKNLTVRTLLFAFVLGWLGAETLVGVGVALLCRGRRLPCTPLARLCVRVGWVG
jgi:hypothetical protein